MRAIWSFWSKPYESGRCRSWTSDTHHLLSWVLSTQTAMKHYRPAALYTDDAGARLLVDGAGLEFDEVHTSLNALADHDPGWWALGKVYAYRQQEAPFVHIDSDVFLWKRLREDLESAPVIAQHPEDFVPGRSFYRPEVLEAAVDAVWDGWLPPEWAWYRRSGLPSRGESCGIIGGNQVDFLRHYAERAVRLIEHPGNQAAWEQVGDKAGNTVLFEQYLLSACVEHHRHHPDSPYHEVRIDYVFPTARRAFSPDAAAEVGYTHIMAGSKRNPKIADALVARVAADYPESYERCARYLARREQYSCGVSEPQGAV
jgi:hypothetical protein